MLGVREATIAICDADPDIVTKDAEEQGEHVIVGLAAADGSTKFCKNSVTVVAEVPGTEFGTQDTGMGTVTSKYKMLNIPLQLLQYPLLSSLTSNSTLNEEGIDAMHI